MSEVKEPSKFNFDEIRQWKSPKNTIIFLVVLNIIGLYFCFYSFNFVSTIIQCLVLSLIWSFVSNIIHPDRESSQCKCMSEECIKKHYVFIYDNINKLMQYFSKVIVSNEKKELITLIIILLCACQFGNVLGSIAFIVVALDVYIALGNDKVNKIIDTYVTKGYQYVEHLIKAYVPKYKGD